MAYMLMWLALMIGLLVVEGMTYALTTIWFAIGSLAGAVAAYLGYPLMTQIITFGVVSLLFLLVTRPLALKYMKKGLPKTNVNSKLGQKAIVIEPVDNPAQTGKVKLYDVEWLASSTDDAVAIPQGTVVEIEKVEGVRLYVKPAK